MTRAIGLAVFAAIAFVGVGLDQLSRRRVISGPSLSELVDWLQARTSGQVALFILWGFAGWHFFVR